MQQINRVHRALRRFFMLEVCERVTPGGAMLRQALEHCLPFFIAIRRFAVTVVAEVRGHNIWSRALFVLSNAQRPIVFLEQVVNVVREPGLMPKFKRCPCAARQDGKKFFKHRNIHLHVGRQLKQYWCKLTCSRQRLDRGEESREEITGIFQPLDMGDDLVGLDGKTKMLGRLVNPFQRCRVFQQLAKSKVDFDSVEFRGVVAKEFRLREFCRIKIGLPCGIRPSRCANINLRHRNSGKIILTSIFAVARTSIPCHSETFAVASRRGRARNLLYHFFFAAFLGAAFFTTLFFEDTSPSCSIPPNFGSFCFNVSSGANKSPCFSTRFSTCSASNTSNSASFFLRHRWTS